MLLLFPTSSFGRLGRFLFCRLGTCLAFLRTITPRLVSYDAALGPPSLAVLWSFGHNLAAARDTVIEVVCAHLDGRLIWRW